MMFLVFVLPVAYWKIFDNEDKNSPVNIPVKTNGKAMTILLLLVLLSAKGFQADAQTVYSLQDCRKMALSTMSREKFGIGSNGCPTGKKSAFTRYFPKVTASGAYLSIPVTHSV